PSLTRRGVEGQRLKRGWTIEDREWRRGRKMRTLSSILDPLFSQARAYGSGSGPFSAESTGGAVAGGRDGGSGLTTGIKGGLETVLTDSDWSSLDGGAARST